MVSICSLCGDVTMFIKSCQICTVSTCTTCTDRCRKCNFPSCTVCTLLAGCTRGHMYCIECSLRCDACSRKICRACPREQPLLNFSDHPLCVECESVYTVCAICEEIVSRVECAHRICDDCVAQLTLKI